MEALIFTLAFRLREGRRGRSALWSSFPAAPESLPAFVFQFHFELEPGDVARGLVKVSADEQVKTVRLYAFVE